MPKTRISKHCEQSTGIFQEIPKERHSYRPNTAKDPRIRTIWSPIPVPQRADRPSIPRTNDQRVRHNNILDADHAHDIVTGRSIAGIILFVESKPVYWKSTRQTYVNNNILIRIHSTVQGNREVAVITRYQLRSMEAEFNKPTEIFFDNKSVFFTAANPASTLNKKAIMLVYHYLREHQARGVIEVLSI